MKSLSNLLPALLIPLMMCDASASGRRTTVVTLESIKEYKPLVINADTVSEHSVNYVGTLNGTTHILIVTKTSYPPKVEVRPGVFELRGRPWDHLFSYYANTETLTIENSWDITNLVNSGEFEVRPSYCPRLIIKPDQHHYMISDNEEIRNACLEMRRPRLRR